MRLRRRECQVRILVVHLQNLLSSIRIFRLSIYLWSTFFLPTLFYARKFILSGSCLVSLPEQGLKCTLSRTLQSGPRRLTPKKVLVKDEIIEYPNLFHLAHFELGPINNCLNYSPLKICYHNLLWNPNYEHDDYVN